MDYEKKYKEVLELARVAAFNGHQSLMEGIFPELKCSEDEKIREYLIRYIDNTMKSSELKSKLLAWLEKQGTPNKTLIWKHWKDGICGNGEGKPIYLIKYGCIYSLSSCLCFECDYIELSELDKLLSEKQGEQEPAWSEEDERMCQETIDWFEKKCFPYALENDNPAKESIKWLKSLKGGVQPKNTWKPSIAQLNALSIVSKGNAPDDIEAIMSLYNDLKKLKGE